MAKKIIHINEQLKPENQTKFRRLIQKTREKKVLWYISRINHDLVEFTCQEENGDKIYLTHNKRKDVYRIKNIAGMYTYAQFKALEEAILGAGHQEPFHSEEYERGLHSEEIQKKKQVPEEKVQKNKAAQLVISTEKKSGDQQIPKKTGINR